MNAAEIERRAMALGATSAKVISPKKVFTGQWVRMKCRYGCGGFGESRNCPPHSPTPDETRRMLDEYTKALLVRGDRTTNIRRIVATLERDFFLAGYYRAFAFACGPCRLCEGKCVGPTEACRHPAQARPSMEACGIDVYATVRAAGFPIQVVVTRNDKQNYYGLVLLD